MVHDGTFSAFGARSRALTCKTRLPQQTPFLVQSLSARSLSSTPPPLPCTFLKALPSLRSSRPAPSLASNTFPHPWPDSENGPARRRARVRPHPLAPDSGAQTRRGAARQRLVSLLPQVRAHGSMAEPPSTKGTAMTVGDALVRIRKERNLTQEGLARQAFSHPPSRLSLGERRDLAEHRHVQAVASHLRHASHRTARNAGCAVLQSFGMPFFQPEDRGTKEADGTPSEDFCSWCSADSHVRRGRVAGRAYRALRSRHGRDMWHLARRGHLLHGRPSPGLKRWE